MTRSTLTGLLVALAVVAIATLVRPSRRSRTIVTSVGSTDPPTRSHPVVLRAGALMVGVLVVLVAGPVPVVVFAAAAAGSRSWRRQRTQRRGRVAVAAALPDATEVLVACLHAGRSPTQAIGDVARLGPVALRPAFDGIEQRLHRGQGVAEALDELVERCGPAALPLVTATSAAIRDGLPLAPLLDRLTDEAMASRRRQGEAAARRLPVRLSIPLVVCTLPAFVLLSIAPAILGAVSSLRIPTP